MFRNLSQWSDQLGNVLELLRDALADRYDVERELGRGGMALVYLARDIKHDRSVALKVLRPGIAEAMGAERFLREIKVAAKLQHPHILPLYDSGEAGKSLYYVMPFVEGETLRERLARETRLNVEEAVRFAREICDALAYAHAQNVVHRDIKPDNIMLARSHALVSDFGIARAIVRASGDALTQTGFTLGTPAYMSPEQAAGDTDLDGRTDIYSLGCVIFEMLAGQPVFTGPSAQVVIARRFSEPARKLRSVAPDAPEWLEAAVATALARYPADRHATADIMLKALRPSAAASTDSAASTGAKIPTLDATTRETALLSTASVGRPRVALPMRIVAVIAVIVMIVVLLALLTR
ncbi:MAG: serine/threonine-protein kinase [Gemmatimonadaceae bacterium]